MAEKGGIKTQHHGGEQWPFELRFTAEAAQVLQGAFVAYPVSGPSAPRRAGRFHAYLCRLWQQRLPVTCFVLAVLAATYLVSCRMTPLYEAFAVLDLDRQSVTGAGANDPQSAAQTEQFVATQIRLLQSDAVLRPVAHKYHLAGAQAAEGGPITLPNLTLVRPPNTSLLQVSYRHPDPRIAADVANSLATSYLQQVYQAGFSQWHLLTAFSEGQVQALKARMEESADALARFEREKNLINPVEKAKLAAERLQQLSRDYTQAQTDRLAKEAMVRVLRSSPGTIDGMQQSTAGQAEIELREAVLREQGMQRALAEAKAASDRLHTRSFQYEVLKQNAEADKKTYEELQRHLRKAGAAAGLRANGIRIVDLARPSKTPVSPNLPLNCLVAFAGSLLVAVTAVFLRDAADDKIKDWGELRELCGGVPSAMLPMVKAWRKWPTLGVDASRPVQPELNGSHLQETVRHEEAVRMLRSELLATGDARSAVSLLVTGPRGREGTSTVAASLAVAEADLGKRTLLVDANVRRPLLHRLVFSTSAGLGLSNVLQGQAEWQEVLIQETGRPLMHLLPAGSPTNRMSELVYGALPKLLQEWTSQYDAIILDGPAFLRYAEAFDIAAMVDGVVVTARAGQTNHEAVGQTLTRLRRVSKNIWGVVLTGAGG